MTYPLGTARTMTSAHAEARNIVHEFGWSEPDDTHGHLECPVCRRRIGVQWFSWTPSGGRSIALRTVLAEHLLDEHPVTT